MRINRLNAANRRHRCSADVWPSCLRRPFNRDRQIYVDDPNGRTVEIDEGLVGGIDAGRDHGRRLRAGKSRNDRVAIIYNAG